MEGITGLRQQAAQLRRIAAQGGDHPRFVERILELATHCEELADSLSETLAQLKLEPPSES